MKTTTSNKKRKENNFFNNAITDEKIKHVINHAMTESKDINDGETLLPFMANHAMELSDSVCLSTLVIVSPLLSIVSFMCVRESAH